MGSRQKFANGNRKHFFYPDILRKGSFSLGAQKKHELFQKPHGETDTMDVGCC